MNEFFGQARKNLPNRFEDLKCCKYLYKLKKIVNDFEFPATKYEKN